jgi:hypothetical protein
MRELTERPSSSWKYWLAALIAVFLAYRSLFVGDAHEIGSVRDRIAGAFNMFGLLPQANGFDGEHGFGGRTTLIHRQMVRDPAYAEQMIALTEVNLLKGPRDADWWNVLIIRLVPIDSDLKAAVSYYAESKLCTLNPTMARSYTSQCEFLPASAMEATPSLVTTTPTAQAVAPTKAQTSIKPQRFERGCEAGSNYYRHLNDSEVICGCGYNYHAQSRDGTGVCAGGLYNYHAESRDGTMVACGGQYNYHAESRDGNDVCAGGLYNYHTESRNGNDVACGGLYNYRAESRDGNAVCAGGLYNYHTQSRNGNAVACGGQYNYMATSRDGSMKCYGGRY